jgi:CHAT domain-containing protein
LDSLPFDDTKRRDFMVWLSQRYDLVAYAHATHVTKQASGRDDRVEALDIYASSFDKDVFAELSITRQPDGSIRYVRDVYLAEEARERTDQMFVGLHRPSHSASVTNGQEFEDVCATLESKVYWRGVNKQANEPSGDEAGALITRALQLYASGNCEAALPLGEKATELLRKQDRENSRDFATALVAQALCHKKLVHVAEAERLYRQAIEIYEKVAGTNSRDLAIALDNLARLVQVAYGAGASSSELMNEGYVAAQRALDTNASLALSQLAARHSIGESALAGLLRERQDLLQELDGRDKLLIAAVAKAPDQRDQAGEDRLKSRIEEIGGRIDEIDRSLSKQAPQYAALSKPTPISIADTQALLKPDEALLQFIDLQSIGPVPETGFAWLVTKESAEWVRLPIGTQGLARAVAALRCGLDAKRWVDGGEILCGELLKLDKSARAWLPFDLSVAYELYQTLIGPFEAKIKGKHLLVVPSGALTGLPLSVLVTEKPIEAVPLALDGYRNAAWLGQRQPITVLPSVSSLKALRQFAKNSGATKPYLGIGNPLLDGVQDDYQFGAYYKKQAQLARDKQQCRKTVTQPIVASARGPVTDYAKLFRGGNANIEAIRAWPPLPETADELCEVGLRLGVPESEILLGGHATEVALKGLSEQGRLADYGIVHFATHGALTGDVQGSAEPGLILTPPDKDMIDPKALDRDDGFLTASEIATLKLDADWVILSACNTAGGSGETAEALSGMARAFFYAGARALLVSHWAVDSAATVRLTTTAMHAMSREKGMGRAQAMRNSMLGMIDDKGKPALGHPTYWAPFVVVGEGAAQQ